VKTSKLRLTLKAKLKSKLENMVFTHMDVLSKNHKSCSIYLRYLTSEKD
jgi:hypothetical protein